MMKSYLLFLWIACASVLAQAQEALVPQPKQMQVGLGRVRISDISYISVQGAEMPVLYGLLDELPRMAQTGVGVHLILDTSLSRLGKEGYNLKVNPKSIQIKAPTSIGLFYGAVTLSQLIREAQDCKCDLRVLSIEDEPSLPVRAVHFDTKHHLDRSEYYYRMLDRLAQWKVNTVIWEIEDKLRFERRPECASPNALSKQEMRAIADYAHERHINIEPLVQGLGHAGFILKNHWELRENAQSDWEFCPANPETYALQYDLYQDALEAFPFGNYLHVGGDEITEIGIDQRCKATGKTPFQLQMQWLEKVCSFAKQHGRTPIFWDDMPLKYGDLWWVIHRGLSNAEVDKNWHTDKLDEAVELFPKDCIYMRWHYDDPTIYPHLKTLEWYKNKGLRVMGATAAADGGSPYMPRYGSKVEHIRAFCRLAVTHNLNEGILATCWDDGSPHWETVTRGFAALGEFSWNPEGRDGIAFKRAFEHQYYGLYGCETSFIEKLEQAAAFFDDALISLGRRNPAWQVRDYTLIELPDSLQAGAWCRTYAALLDSARTQAGLCKGLEGSINEAKIKARRNRYALDIYKANNRLFAFPAKVLLALEEYDRAIGQEERDDARKRIGQICDEFEQTKSALISTYGKTRFMSNPNGYIQDNNHHRHLAALRPDASWLTIYEDDFIKAVKTKLQIE